MCSHTRAHAVSLAVRTRVMFMRTCPRARTHLTSCILIYDGFCDPVPPDPMAARMNLADCLAPVYDGLWWFNDAH